MAVDVLALYRYARSHGFHCTVDDDTSISVFIPWTNMHTGEGGVEEVRGIDSMVHLREVLGY